MASFASVGCVLLLLVSLGMVTCKADSLSELNALVENFWDWRMQNVPTYATDSGVSGYDDKLESFDYNSFTERKNKCEDFLKDLQNINRDTLTSAADKLNYDMLKSNLETYINGYKWLDYGALNPVNFLEGIHIEFSYVIEHTPFTNKKNFDDYISRLSKFPELINQQIALMRRAISLKRTDHLVSVEKVPSQINNTITSLPPLETNFYQPFNDTLDNVTQIDNAEKQNLRSQAANVIQTLVQPAFANLSSFMENEYKPNTRPNISVTSLDNGTEFYTASLQWHLTNEMTPQEVHNIGLEQVKTISEKMIAIMRNLSFSGTIREFVSQLENDTRFHMNSSEALLKEYEDIIYNIVHPKLPLMFKDLPDIKVIVRPMPNDGAGGQYMGPSADGKRPGVFEANLHRPDKVLTVDMMALCLHEAEPGHHLQAASAIVQNLPRYRKETEYSKYYAVPFNFPFQTAYSEGWALYAEALGEAHEMDTYRNQYELFGRYSSEIFRACRLVVDTGMHAMGWSRDQAIDFLKNYTANPIDDIRIEIDRYITWPGQACAYKIGEIKIWQLRQKAQKELGSKFDIKEFHHRILIAGPVPLNLLETVIDDYISETLMTTAKKTNGPASGSDMLNTAITLLITNIIFIHLYV